MLKVVYQIHPQFKTWMLDKISYAGSYIVDRAVKNVTPDELFEALIPEEHWKTLRKASKLMPTKNYQHYMVQLMNGIDELHLSNPLVNMNIVFRFMTPNHLLLPMKLSPIRYDSKLLEYLTPSLSLARDWATLHLVTKNLIELTNDRNMLANLLPWLPDLVRESGWILIPDEDAKTVNHDRRRQREVWYRNEVGITQKHERYACDRTFIAAVKRRTPALALTSDVRDAIASGSRLFTQYRLAKQDKHENSLTKATITPSIDKDLVHPAILKGLEDIKAIYKHEQN